MADAARGQGARPTIDAGRWRSTRARSPLAVGWPGPWKAMVHGMRRSVTSAGAARKAAYFGRVSSPDTAGSSETWLAKTAVAAASSKGRLPAL